MVFVEKDVPDIDLKGKTKVFHLPKPDRYSSVILEILILSKDVEYNIMYV